MVITEKLDSVAQCDLLLIELQGRLRLAQSDRLRWEIRDSMDEVLDHRLKLVRRASKKHSLVRA